MKKSKTFIGISLLILTLVTLFLNAFKSAPDLGPKVAVTSIEHLKDALAAKENLLYKKHQDELKVALQAYFYKAISAGDIVGAGVSIVKDDSILISDGYGKRNINRDEGVDGGTIFRLGSLSKGFAGVLAAELKDEGKLHWEDRVSDFIPEFKFGDKDNTNKITLANILSHTSGTPYHSYTNLVEAGLPLQDIAQRFKDITPISEPGSMYSYQNAMFALCGEMIHKATGQDISEVLTNTFFNPLGMCSTTMDYETLTHTENVAMPHSKRRNSWKTLPLSNNYYNAIAAGGISASSVDMAKWMRFLLGHNPELMSKSALAETFSPFIEIKGGSKYYQHWPGHKASYYGYGWRIHKFHEKDSDQEKTIWHHGGSVNNYRNEIAIYPEADLGICVLLSNNSRIAKTVIPDLYAIVKEIYGKTAPYNNFKKGDDLVQLHLE
ncbi:serine hydrolase [Arenibacter sp. ARW7G5Y1]|uniref:serine hydrolase domain-containing protein n=1 Tax=Arenibacter sp. ARW7G5Y1 TaxID=2135619 RepID=UPI000D75E046|nr:serine hydrolase domain-containing protein [Arenibacter sp. ARW7G5Y1]PXX29902.1 beta-lactamase class C [Arenibacter sp. ARW7G5Y1]